MIIFFSASGCFFAFIFILLILGGAAADFCNSVTKFFTHNAVILSVILIAISAIISFAWAKIIGSLKYMLGIFLVIAQLLLCFVYGFYSVIEMSEGSFFLLLIGVIPYVAVSLIDIGITGYITANITEKRGLPLLYLWGILGFVLNLAFW